MALLTWLVFHWNYGTFCILLFCKIYSFILKPQLWIVYECSRNRCLVLLDWDLFHTLISKTLNVKFHLSFYQTFVNPPYVMMCIRRWLNAKGFYLLLYSIALRTFSLSLLHIPLYLPISCCIAETWRLKHDQIIINYVFHDNLFSFSYFCNIIVSGIKTSVCLLSLFAFVFNCISINIRSLSFK